MENINTNSIDNYPLAESSEELQLRLLQNAFDEEEKNYIKNMMEKNPVIMVSRKTTTKTDGEANATNARAETCRKSRLNSKLKKAETAFRHQFANEKLKETTELHATMQNMLVNAEAQLLKQGFSAAKLKEMREKFGLVEQVPTLTTPPESSSDTEIDPGTE